MVNSNHSTAKPRSRLTHRVGKPR